MLEYNSYTPPLLSSFVFSTPRLYSPFLSFPSSPKDIPERKLSSEEEEAKRIAEMGKPVLGEHAKLEVIIEESYEFKVGPCYLSFHPQLSAGKHTPLTFVSHRSHVFRFYLSLKSQRCHCHRVAMFVNFPIGCKTNGQQLV